jgi:hypothetical protein
LLDRLVIGKTRVALEIRNHQRLVVGHDIVADRVLAVHRQQRPGIVGDRTWEFSALSDEVFAVLVDRGDDRNPGVEDVGCALGERIQRFTPVTFQDSGCLQRVHTLCVVVRQCGLLGRLCFFRIDNTVDTADCLVH